MVGEGVGGGIGGIGGGVGGGGRRGGGHGGSFRTGRCGGTPVLRGRPGAAVPYGPGWCCVVRGAWAGQVCGG
ncbi:hypothetical protein F3K30_19070 [Streptomyces sp. LBUM 1487]|nr:hypothetical protein [Streptomyces sp. LBUM 1487]